MLKNRFAVAITLSLGAVLGMSLIAGPVFAQAQPGAGRGQGRGQGRGGARGVSLANLPIGALDSILKLTADQKTKATAIQEKYRTDTAALRPAQGQAPDPANTAKLRELTTQANKDLEALLTDEQKTKWTAARKDLALLASAGIPPALFTDIKLTDEQKIKLAAIQKETTDKVQALPQDQRRAAMQEARQKAADVLTADQKAAIEKYNKEHPRGRRRQP